MSNDFASMIIPVSVLTTAPQYIKSVINIYSPSQGQYIVKQKGKENIEIHQLAYMVLMHCQILKSDIKGNVRRNLRRITN